MQQQQMPPPSSIPSEQESHFDSLPDSQSFETKCSLHVLRRREPLGASANKPDKKGGEGGAEFSAAKQQQIVRPSVEVVIPNEIGELPENISTKIRSFDLKEYWSFNSFCNIP